MLKESVSLLPSSSPHPLFPLVDAYSLISSHLLSISLSLLTCVLPTLFSLLRLYLIYTHSYFLIWPPFSPGGSPLLCMSVLLPKTQTE